MSDTLEYQCPRCQIGHCQLGLATFVHLYDDTLVTMPDMPAWTCDICHYQEFDPDAVLRVEALVGQAGTPPNTHRPAPKPGLVDASDSDLTRRVKP